jgi:uridine kinase
MSVVELAGAIASRFSPESHCLVGISGLDCAGKSTLAERLARRSDWGRPAQIVSVDDFLHPRRIRNANPDQLRGYYHETFDLDAIFAVLRQARSAVDFAVEVPVLDWQSDTPGRRVFSASRPSLFLVEGVFLFRPPLVDLFDLRIWIDLSFDDALARALRRERDLAYYASTEAIRDRYLRRFFPAQRHHIDVDRPASQSLVVQATHLEEPP